MEEDYTKKELEKLKIKEKIEIGYSTFTKYSEEDALNSAKKAYLKWFPDQKNAKITNDDFLKILTKHNEKKCKLCANQLYLEYEDYQWSPTGDTLEEWRGICSNFQCGIYESHYDCTKD